MESASRHRHPSLGPSAASAKGLFVNVYGQSTRRIPARPPRAHFVLAAMQRELDLVQSSLELDHALGTQDQVWMFVVADAPGSVAGDEPTSALAVRFSLESLRETLPAFVRIDDDRPAVVEHALGEVVESCHRLVREQALRRAGGSRPGGSCLSLAFVQWPHLFVAQVGDTQCYVMRQGRLRQIVGESGPAQQTVAVAISSPANGPQYGAEGCGRLLGDGAGGAPRPALHRRLLRRGDTLLLCTAGLGRTLGHAAIESVLQAEIFAKTRCHSLLDAAAEAGNEDDVSVVVASFDSLS